MGSLHCNFCGEELRLRQQPPWRYSAQTLGLFVLAGIVGAVGIPLMIFGLSEVFEAGPGVSQLGFVIGMGAAMRTRSTASPKASGPR